MSGARATARLLGMAAVTGVLLVPALLVGLLALPLARPAASGPGAARCLDALALGALLSLQRTWCRLMLALLGVRVRVVGPSPRGAALLVCNHLSYLDIPVIGSVAGCRFVSKAEVSRWPVVGCLARVARVMFLDRTRRKDLVRVGADMRATLDAGAAVTIFPEGTSSRGEGVLPFHPGLLQPAAEAGIACRALAIHYETPDDCRPPAWTICWWGDMTFGPHIWNLMKIPRIDATLHVAPESVTAADRKHLAADLHARVAAAFRPVRQQPTEGLAHDAADAADAADPADAADAAVLR